MLVRQSILDDRNHPPLIVSLSKRQRTLPLLRLDVKFRAQLNDQLECLELAVRDRIVDGSILLVVSEVQVGATSRQKSNELELPKAGSIEEGRLSTDPVPVVHIGMAVHDEVVG